jgi:hypothetical protein
MACYPFHAVKGIFQCLQEFGMIDKLYSLETLPQVILTWYIIQATYDNKIGSSQKMGIMQGQSQKSSEQGSNTTSNIYINIVITSKSLGVGSRIIFIFYPVQI